MSKYLFIFLSTLFFYSTFQLEANAAKVCEIRIGGGGKTRTYRAILNPGQIQTFSKVKKSDFIRSTTGPCHFRIYNSKKFRGHNTTLGTDLTGRIRAGMDGIRKRKHGGGSTWRIRSLKIYRPRGTTRGNICKIRIGGNSRRMTYYNNVLNTPASDFIDYTDSSCYFKIYNHANFSGRYVTLGSDLRKKIRAGKDGIKNKTYGGGDTWRIRSIIKSNYSNRECKIRIGGNSVRMNYYTGSFPHTPAMDRISQVYNGNCQATIWNAPNFGEGNRYNKHKVLQPNGKNRNYNPGYRTRSMKVEFDDVNCSEETQENGKCLPETTLAESLFTEDNNALDEDQDGLVDSLENRLANTFRPVYYFDSAEFATRRNIYRVNGRWVHEPATLFQVSPTDEADKVVIRFMKLWQMDGSAGSCWGHRGDTESHSITLKTVSGNLYGRFWYPVATGGGISNGDLFGGSGSSSSGEYYWQQGSNRYRRIHYERFSGESRDLPGTHMAMYFTKGKHHQYADAGWSGSTDKHCKYGKAYMNARMRRAAILQTPDNIFEDENRNYNNVGNQDYPFLDELQSYGFGFDRIWNDGKFVGGISKAQARDFLWRNRRHANQILYKAAAAVDRHFD